MPEPKPPMDESLPDPALVVVIGASGSGKSTWAAGAYRMQEIISSDRLRGIVGSGPHDLDASVDAFALLDLIIDGRLRRRLMTVVDTLGLDGERRRRYVEQARRAQIPCVAVLLDTSDVVCRQRNRERDRPVPAAVLTAQLRRVREVAGEIATEGWDRVVTVRGSDRAATQAAPTGDAEAGRRPTRQPAGDSSGQVAVFLQVSRFPWGADPARWLRDVAYAAEESGFAGLSLMDHLIQIPQVDRAWEPIPEPWVTLGLLAGLDTELRLGTLVTPITLRPAGVTAKAVATLDVLSGGRAFCGIGAGWWAREHAAFGVPFPPVPDRLDQLETAIETMRALWGKGTRPYDGDRVSLPETTCYPRPLGDVPIIVGGSGEARTLRIAARLGDGCNLPSDLGTLDRKLSVLRRHCDEVGRDIDDLTITVLDLPVIGRDRDDVWARVERLRGRASAAAYAERHHAGTLAEHQRRYEELAGRGVRTVFVAPPDLSTADDVRVLAPLASALT